MLVIDIKIAKIPKASGPYKRVNNGAAKIPSSWAEVVPDTTFNTSLANDVLLRETDSVDIVIATGKEIF